MRSEAAFVAVPAYSLCSPAFLNAQSNDLVTFSRVSPRAIWSTGYHGTSCTWTGCEYCSADPFLTNIALGGSLIAFVGPNPYYWGSTNEWGNSSYFPQGASTNGYFAVGNSNGVFRSDRAGWLWYSINDDAIGGDYEDNWGYMI